MRGVYLSVKRCEELFQDVLGGRGTLLVYALLADATIARLYKRLRRSQPKLPPSDLELICESGFLKAARRLVDFETWAQTYGYALMVARSLRRQHGRKHPVEVERLDDVLEPVDPSSAWAEERVDSADIILALAEQVGREDREVILHRAGTLLHGTGSKRSLSRKLGLSLRTTERLCAKALNRARKYLSLSD
jgi:DNA-directed RNA polymerase specialized sigma24 family protein